MDTKRLSFGDWCRQNGHKTPLRQWDYGANGFGPEDISFCSQKDCHWTCEKNRNTSGRSRPGGGFTTNPRSAPTVPGGSWIPP